MKTFYGGTEFYPQITSATGDSLNNIILVGILQTGKSDMPLLFPFKSCNLNVSIERSFIIILDSDGSLKFSSYWLSTLGIRINGVTCLQDDSLVFIGIVRTADYNLSSEFQSAIPKQIIITHIHF